MRLKAFWRFMIASAAAVLLIGPALFVSRPSPAGPTITVYKSPT